MLCANGTWAEMCIRDRSTIGISVPTFIIGAVLVYIVGFELGWFPVALWRGPSYMVLPVLTLAAQPMAFIARLTRSGLICLLYTSRCV